MRQLETSSLSNQNISAFLLAHTFTADADRAIFARIHLDQVAGGGDYQIYATIQAGGAGAAFMEGPISTFTVPTAIISVGFVSILIPVNSGDVVKFYVKGLAGDTATPDIVTRIFELTYLRPTTAGRTLDVSATGEAGVDLDNIKDAAAPKTLTNITVPVVTTVTNQQDVLTPLAVVDGIVDAVKVKTDNLPTDPADESLLEAAITAAIPSVPTVTQIRQEMDANSSKLAYLNASITSRMPATGGAALVNVVGPVAAGGDIEIVSGDDYYNADGRALEWSSADWPDLTGATVTFETGSTSIAMTVVTAGAGITQTVRLELSKVQTAALKGGFAFDVDAVLTGAPAHEVTLVRANGSCK